MATIARDFAIWLLCFSGVSVVALAVAHAAIKRFRSRKASERTPHRYRAAFVVLVLGLYALVLGPVTIDLLKFLKQPASPDSAPAQLTVTATPIDDGQLVPVPDPISSF